MVRTSLTVRYYVMLCSCFWKNHSKLVNPKVQILCIKVMTWNNCSSTFRAHKICHHSEHQNYCSALNQLSEYLSALNISSFYWFSMCSLAYSSFVNWYSGPETRRKIQNKMLIHKQLLFPVYNCHYAGLNTKFIKVNNSHDFNILELDFNAKRDMNCSQQPSL